MPMIDQIRPRDLHAWLDAARVDGEPVVLDVREPQELAIASVKADGFTLVAIPMQSIPARLTELDAQRPVACLCHHGSRSMQVAMFLQRNGFTHVSNIAGGIHAWADEIDSSVPRY